MRGEDFCLVFSLLMIHRLWFRFRVPRCRGACAKRLSVWFRCLAQAPLQHYSITARCRQ